MFTYFFTYFSIIIRNNSIMHSRCLSRGTDCKAKEILHIIGLLLIELFEIATLLLLGLLLFEKLSPNFAAIEDRAVVWLKIACVKTSSSFFFFIAKSSGRGIMRFLLDPVSFINFRIDAELTHEEDEVYCTSAVFAIPADNFPAEL